MDVVTCMPYTDPSSVAAKACMRRSNVKRYQAWKAAGLCMMCGRGRDGRGVRCTRCAARWCEYRRRDRAQAWNRILDHYGPMCACCGETNRLFLTVDHINNDGHKHRRKPGRGGGAASGVTNNWERIRKAVSRGTWPTDIRILCYNCNCGRARNGGVCPREARKAEAA